MNTAKTTVHIKLGAVVCAIYVALVAFGAHGLKPLLTDAQINTYETGLRYMIVHDLALIVVNLVYRTLNTYYSWTNRFFYLGLVLFSLSLLIHATKDLIGIEVNVFAMLAPIGGLSFIGGWLFFILSLRNK